jgi:predicted house-cleaning noncanonical NTP pyrophosphatase (MazG superfamily)
MDKKRIRDEVIEILANKLHRLPTLADGDSEGFDFLAQKLIPEITDNHLDISEVAMDLEDAFGVNFEDVLPGGQGMETIGQVVEFLAGRLEAQRPA